MERLEPFDPRAFWNDFGLFAVFFKIVLHLHFCRMGCAEWCETSAVPFAKYDLRGSSLRVLVKLGFVREVQKRYKPELDVLYALGEPARS